MLAGEVFKRARGLTNGKYLESFGYSLWTGQTGKWTVLENGPELRQVELPPLYVVGAGAVGQAFIQIVGSSALSSAYLVTIDDDAHDDTNLNRCFLAGVKDVEHDKIDVIERYRKAAGLEGIEFVGTIKDYVNAWNTKVRDDLARKEDNDLYEIVISCVDKGTSRQDIQGLAPRLSFGGSTQGLRAQANVYDSASDTPCLACHNPPEKDGEAFRKLEQELRALTREQQIAWLRDKVDHVDAVLEYLESTDGCGSVGEAELKSLATRSTREFSASFISMAAGVLLAAKIFAWSLQGRDPSIVRDPMTILSFRNLRVEDALQAKDSACRHCGGSQKRR